jgi:hypothetical protein
MFWTDSGVSVSGARLGYKDKKIMLLPLTFSISRPSIVEVIRWSRQIWGLASQSPLDIGACQLRVRPVDCAEMLR